MAHRTFHPTPLADILARRRPASRTAAPWLGLPGEPKPLWAILGEAPPDDWRPPREQDTQLMKLAAAQEPDVVVPLAPPGASVPADASGVTRTRGTGQDSGVGRFVDDLARGAESWFRGIGRAGEHVLDTIGASNAQDQAAARRANHVFADALQQAITHPGATLDIIRQGAPDAAGYVGDHPGTVAGRAGTGAAIGAVTQTPMPRSH